MKDQLVKALVCEGRVRVYIDRTTDMVAEAQSRFHLQPLTTIALGRVLSVASIMGAMLKSDEEMLTININGGGPAGSIIVDAYANGNVRGFVSNPQADLELPVNKPAKVGSLVGREGYLRVIKDLNMEENFEGTVELVSGEIGDDFAYYFTMSEQTPTAVATGVGLSSDNHVESAGALVLQMLPDATDTDIRICEHVLEGLKPMSTIIKEYDDTNLEQLVKDMFEDAEILETRDIQFKCTCSRERMASALLTLPYEEVAAMADEDHGAEITCNFCNEVYNFSEDELRELMKKMKEPGAEKPEEVEEFSISEPETDEGR